MLGFEALEPPQQVQRARRVATAQPALGGLIDREMVVGAGLLAEVVAIGALQPREDAEGRFSVTLGNMGARQAVQPLRVVAAVGQRPAVGVGRVLGFAHAQGHLAPLELDIVGVDPGAGGRQHHRGEPHPQAPDAGEKQRRMGSGHRRRIVAAGLSPQDRPARPGRPPRATRGPGTSGRSRHPQRGS